MLSVIICMVIMATASASNNIWENGSTTSMESVGATGSGTTDFLGIVDATRTGTSDSLDNYNTSVAAHMETVIYLLGFVVNVFGNTTIIVAISKYPWLKHNMYVALQTLAVADLLMSVPIFLLCVRKYTAHLMPGVLYNFIFFWQIPSGMGASYHVTLVAMERFVAVVFPFQYKAYVTPRLIWICSGVTWILALLVSIPGIFLSFSKYLNMTLSPAGFQVANSFANLVGYFSVAIILLFLNGKVILTARMQRKKIESNPHTNGNNKRNPGLNRATQLMVIVVGVFLLLWAPFTASTIATLILQRSNPSLELLRTFGLGIGKYNSSVNFLIYTAFNRKLRLAFKKLLKLGNASAVEHDIEESTAVY